MIVLLAIVLPLATLGAALCAALILVADVQRRLLDDRDS
jgi:hypothetical protein